MTTILDEPLTDTRVTVGAGGDETEERASGGIDIDKLVSFDEPVPCEGGNEGEVKCENEAEYQILTGCCGTQVLFCEDCMLRDKAKLQRAQREGKTSFCRKCGFRTKTNNTNLLIVVGRL